MFNIFKKKEPIIDKIEVVYEEDYSDVEPIARFFHNETGITFDKQIGILTNKVKSFCKQRKIHSFSELLRTIKIQDRLKQELIDYLTTNETFFYREFEQIAELVELVKKSNGQIRILCAPSATGEEVYSITIALLEAGVSASTFKVVGIDINSDAIKKSKDAVYKERNIRNLSPSILSKYFSIDTNHYVVKQNVKSLVSFELHNIFDTSFPNIGKFDFVFSRNMLIYFDKETKQKAKTILEDLRKDKTYGVFFGHADLF